MKRKAAIAAALMIVLTTAPAVSADESKQVYDPDKPVWTTSSEMTSSESTSDGAFTLSGNYGTVEYGSGKSLIVKLTSNSGTASVTGVTVQRKTGGKWVTAAKKNGGKLTSTSNSAAKGQSITFTFTPDLYFAKAVPGDHRLAFTITDGSGSSRNIYYVFNIVNNAEVTTDQASYDLMSTDTIHRPPQHRVRAVPPGKRDLLLREQEMGAGAPQKERTGVNGYKDGRERLHL